MALNVVSVSVSTPSPMKHLVGFEGKNQLLISGKKSNYNKNKNKNNNASVGYSPLTIRCFKGHVAPPPKIFTTTTTTTTTTNGGAVPSTAIQVPEVVNISHFPPDFKFGCSTSALQTEGSLDVDGRGPSTWDSLIPDGTAADSYNRYKEDVQALKNMGVDTYRFSISWSRILPDGTVKGGINQKGIDFYNNLINELIQNGITPLATLFHFDLPQALQTKYNGFLCSDIVCDFKNYADVCFKYFGDRVKCWSTINEPQVFGQYLYSVGLPSTTIQKPATDPFLVFHNIILAHAAAARHYKQNYQETQKGEIGIPLVSMVLKPSDNTRQDGQASVRAMDFLMGWLLDPLVYGDYNFNMKSLVRDALPTFTDEQKTMIKGAYDYIGVNYYSSRFAYDVPITPYQCYTQYTQYQHAGTDIADVNGIPIGPKVNKEMYMFPEGIKDVLLHLKEEYENPKVYITENGTPDEEELQDPLQDGARIDFVKKHLKEVLKAIKLGANVKGYLHWSLMDCKELGEEGYKTRMGLIHIPYPNLERIPKDSSKWFHRFLSERN
ncbi:hypothetical protein LguiA_002332 [Lonicera macranthoides]